MATLEDFEDGVAGDIYPGKTGDGWEVGTNDRFNGVGPPTYRPTPDLVDDIPAAPGSGDLAVSMPGNSAWAIAVDYPIGAGLGGHFFSGGTELGETTVLGMQATITFSTSQVTGSLDVRRYGNGLVITETYDDSESVASNEYEVTVTDFLPAGGLPNDTGLWLDIQFRRGEDWHVRDLATGATLASGAYPWTIPGGALWQLSAFPNADGPFGFGPSLRFVVDNLVGWPGSLSRPAVRMYPRDDGRGMSSAPRIWPMPKSNRIIGGYQ